MDNEEILSAYTTYLRSWKAKPRTVKSRLTLVKSRLNAWGLEGMTRANIEAFLAADADGKERKDWTTATYYNHLSDFCEFLVTAELLPANPMNGMKRSKQPRRRPHPLSEAEIERVLDRASGLERDWLQLALLAGLRAFEIAKIRGEDFTDEGLHVIGKGGVEAWLPIHPTLEEMRRRYPARGYWFPGTEDGHRRANTITVKVGRLFRDASIPEGSIHRARHAYATRLLRRGVNVRVVQRLMRHASLDTTAGYLDVVSNEERDAIMLLEAG